MRKTLRYFAFATIVIVPLLAAYYALLAFPPRFLFPHQLIHGNITVHSDETIHPSIRKILVSAQQKLNRSDFYNSNREFNVYICNSNRLFAFFTNTNYKTGGVNYAALKQNSFLRKANIEKNRLYGPADKEVPGIRTFEYFMTHEIAHSVSALGIGYINYWKLPEWKREGYADYIALKTSFNFHDAKKMLLEDHPSMNPETSGLYLRYHLLTAYLLDIKKIDLGAFFASYFDIEQLEKDILKLP